MKIRNITETTAGATSSGSVASVAKPLGKMQERTEVSGLHTAEKVMKGKTKKKGPYRNSLSESEFNTKQQVIDYFVKRGKTAQQGAAAWERGWRGTKKPTKPTKPASDWMARWEDDKQERENKLSEAELSEQDLIIVPGMRKIKDTSFIPHKLDRRDHEVEMARSEIYAAAKDAMRIFKLLKDRTEDQGIMGWQQSYITLASDYLNSVADSLDYDANVQEMTGGVLAGGMSNFEEGVTEGTINAAQALRDFNAMAKVKDKLTYNGIKEAGHADKILNAISACSAFVNHFKNNKDLNSAKIFDTLRSELIAFKNGDITTLYHLIQRGSLDKINLKEEGVAEGSDVEYVVVIRDEHGKRSIRVSALTPTDAKEKAEAQGYKVIKVKDPREAHYFREQAVAETLMKCPKCGGPSYLDQKIAEEKDACYHKVKSRYKVWPSAYASGALVRCRKVGASNWGNKSKK